MSKKVIVFGGSGFLGSYVSDELTRNGYQVTIADITPSKYLQSEKQSFIKVNIKDLDSVKDVIRGNDIVYSFAGIAGLQESNDSPLDAVETNVIGHLNILEGCRLAKIEKIIFASSAYATSHHGSFYGIAKFTCEKLTEEYLKKYGLNFIVIRYGSLYGERSSHNNYIYNLLKDALKYNEIKYRGNNEDVREYIHAADAAKLSVRIIEEAEFLNQHIILTGSEKMRRIELITMINEIMLNKLKVTQLETSNDGHYKITPYAFHPTKAKKLIANPFIDMGQGLLEIVQKLNLEQSLLESQDD